MGREGGGLADPFRGRLLALQDWYHKQPQNSTLLLWLQQQILKASLSRPLIPKRVKAGQS